MSEDEKRIDRLWWRAWVTNRKMKKAANIRDYRALARHLVSIEDELQQFLCEVAT